MTTKDAFSPEEWRAHSEGGQPVSPAEAEAIEEIAAALGSD
jgi:hypothetical protein